MPQPMTPAPSAKEGLLELADLLRRGAKAVVPAPLPGRGFGDMIIAGLRSAVPGGGSFQEELKKYAQDPMWGDDSVMDDPGLKERDVMAMSGMAAPIVGHASPHKWTGRPKWEAKGSGQGAATWGEAAAYASVPENFGPRGYPRLPVDAAEGLLPSTFSGVGIDSMYRKMMSPAVAVDRLIFKPGRDFDPDIVQALRQSLEEVAGGPGMYAHESGTLEGALIEKLRERKLKFARAVLDPRNDANPEMLALRPRAVKEAQAAKRLAALDLVEPGSFHVWDLPDDAKIINQLDLLKQHPELVDSVARGDPWIANMLRGSPDNPMRVKDFVEGHGDKAIKALRDLGYDATKYYGEQNFTFGGDNPVQNYTILNPDKIEPLGTFNTALDFWKSPLAEELWPRIQKEMAERLRERKLLFGPGAK